MKKHPLLIYEIISRSVRLKLLILTFILFLAGIYDLLNPFLGDIWFLVWIAFVITFGLWFYYGFMMKRATVQLRPKYLRLQGPLYGMNISYARIQAVKSVTMAREWPLEKLGFFDRGRLRPLYSDTAVFVALGSVPKTYKRRHIWFPKYIFGTSEPGLLLVARDWMAVSQDIENARTRYYHQREDTEDRRSLAMRLLDD